MPTLMQYAYIAQEVYRPFTDGQRCLTPDFGCNPGFCRNDRPASLGGDLLSSGLQGRVFFHDRSNAAVIAFKGTEPNYAGTGRAMVSDFVADLAVTMPLLIPRQVAEALALVATWKHRLKGYHLTLTGHSLGGAIVQVVGLACDIRFVAFNGPGMWTNSWGAAGLKGMRNADSNGVNYILQDFIGRRFVHCGRVVDVPSLGHGMVSVIEALENHGDRDKDPLA